MKPQDSKFSASLTLALQLRAYIDSVGLAEAQRVTGLHRETLVKVCSGFPVRKGTILVALQALQGIVASHMPSAAPHVALAAISALTAPGDGR